MFVCQASVSFVRSSNEKGRPAHFYGRFVQPDPLGYEDGPNPYAYVGNDPVNFTDPLGLSEFCWNQRTGGSTYTLLGGTEVVVATIERVCVSFPDFAFDVPFGPTVEIGGGDGGGGSPRPSQCGGMRVTYSYGAGATAAFILGVDVGASVNFSVPNNFSWANPLAGFQVSLSGQIGATAGYGFFAGGGLQRGVGISADPVTTGGSSSYFGTLQAGYGPSVGGNVNVSRPVGSGASGAVGTRVGAGAGLYAGVGKAASGTFAMKPLGC